MGPARTTSSTAAGCPYADARAAFRGLVEELSVRLQACHGQKVWPSVRPYPTQPTHLRSASTQRYAMSATGVGWKTSPA